MGTHPGSARCCRSWAARCGASGAVLRPGGSRAVQRTGFSSNQLTRRLQSGFRKCSGVEKDMSKLLKHLGLGSKKAPPQPPKPDYSALKSSSLDSSLARSPTNEKSASGMSTTSSQISGFEVGQGSPGHRGPEKGFGGARPKDTGGGGVSPHGMQTRPSIQSFGVGEEGEAPMSVENGGSPGATGASATPPRLLDEYSDPADCKKQFEEMRGDGAVLPVVEDDYSVPYEVKKLFKDLVLEGAGADSDSPSKKRDRDKYFGEAGLEEASGIPPLHRGQGDVDVRPKEDYDEPWEWSAKQSRLLQSQVETGNIPPHFLASQTQQTNRTPQLSKRTINTAAAKGGGGDGSSASPQEEADGKVEAARGAAAVTEDTHYEVTRTRRDNDPGSDDEGYTHLREEFVDRPTPPDSLGRNSSSNAEQQQQQPDSQAKVGNYEEPWDLTAKTKELENKIKAASDRASRGEGSAKSEVAGDTGTPPHELDTRAQEGYEKPWDWKPHKKDDRSQEGVSGYEKPWDWKPEQKDDRPPAEYEKPWDQKAKSIEAGIIASSGGASSNKTAAAAVDESDRRPPEEYDEPWDHKLRKHQQGDTPGTASSSDSSPRSGQSPASHSPHHQGASPKKKQHKLNLDLGARAWSAMGERIDPSVPLEQQGWYHGSISRVDAENLLRVHKEGSYLVRMSESNKLDYSLSLKSARGFMHMKIVSRDSKYILGQFSQPFDSIPLMIHHYSISKLPIKGAEHMSLLHPVVNELL